MATVTGALRRQILAPALDEVGAVRRGFPLPPGTRPRPDLESVARAVICGFEWGIDGARLPELDLRVALVDPALQGFAYEGVTMALTILDRMPRGGDRVRTLLTGDAGRHLFLAYIGIGFAMARLPRPLWKDVVPDLPASPFHPVMSWLAVDGYGFDRAFFETDRVVGRQRREPGYPWDGDAGYFQRVCDQGIGRALWFIHGGRVDDVAGAVGGFAAGRRSDLWGGVGLAACFAGGADAPALTSLQQQAGPDAAQLAVGAVFAATARSYSGLVPDSSARSVAALTGLDVAAAHQLGLDTRPGDSSPVGVGRPLYEQWRQTIAGRWQALTGERAGAPA
ncbi:DUF1702 family protein [Kineosporia succinea]|uniref:DUF1702 family protein n=1 Tax=Kineosporia succinea TaxID=84632 RepID=A0ABT9PBY0_9ACTN|nr:DUF1702 family protein [Kineosporia succinea]MDP9829680.1 hypothetical protein [Kineosporia succinea]